MEKYKDKCYNNNFLSNVIFRIDFANPLENARIFHTDIIDAILKEYPKTDREQIIRYGNIEVNIEKGEVKESHNSPLIEGRQRTYISPNMANKVIIANNCLIFEFKKYLSYEILRTLVTDILRAVFKFAEVIIARIGLRYINIFSENSKEHKITKDMFTNSIAATMNAMPLIIITPALPIRSITLTEYKYGDIRINFRSGILNKQYPASMTNNDYIIDIDCYEIGGATCSDDVYIFLDKGHDAIQEMFENSITEVMRKAMKKQDER